MESRKIFRKKPKGLIKVLKDAEKEGRTAKLVYDKLYIDGQRYRSSGKKKFQDRTALNREICLKVP